LGKVIGEVTLSGSVVERASSLKGVTVGDSLGNKQGEETSKCCIEDQTTHGFWLSKVVQNKAHPVRMENLL